MARRTAKGAGRSAGEYAAAVLATIAALGAMYLAVRQVGDSTGRWLSASRLQLDLAYLNALRPDARIGEPELAAAREGAVRSPFAFEPFFIAARAAEQSRRLPEATKLMEQARLRRASSTPTRATLMGYYALSGRYREAIGEADVAMRLNGDAQGAILPILVQMLPFPEARGAIATILARDPSWRAAFIEAAKAKVRPEDAADLLARLRGLRPASGAGPESALVIASLMREQRYPEARRTWLGLVPPAERDRGGLVFDGDFRGVAAPPPFNWSFPASSAGRAGPAKPGPGERPYLEASYFGGAPAVLAEQSLVLAPGRYRLSVAAKADRRELSGQIFWRLSCLPARTELGRLSLNGFTEQYRRYQAEVQVPAGCSAQSLALVGEPGDLSQPVNLDLTQLKVERLG